MISILCPTRGRPVEFHRMCQAAMLLADGDVEVLAYVDEDDKAKDYYRPVENVKLISGQCTSLVQRVNTLATYAVGEVLAAMGDDVIIRTAGWDTKLLKVMPEDGIGVVYPRDGFHNACTHFVVSGKWVTIVGSMLPVTIEHWYADEWVADLARRCGRLIYAPAVYWEHMHPFAKKAPMDDTYERRLDKRRIALDKAAYDRGGEIREEIAKRLRGEME